MTQTTLTEQQIKSVMPEFGDMGEQVVGKATLHAICEMALHTAGLEENLRQERARMHRYRGQVNYQKVKRRWKSWEA